MISMAQSALAGRYLRGAPSFVPAYDALGALAMAKLDGT